MRSTAPVSVVIPTIGRPGIDMTIQSVAEQTTGVDEIIVVADGPLPPVAVDHIENSLDRHAFRKATLLQAERPAGACAARNLGLEASSSPFVTFLDDDDCARVAVAPGCEGVRRADLPAVLPVVPRADGRRRPSHLRRLPHTARAGFQPALSAVRRLGAGA